MKRTIMLCTALYTSMQPCFADSIVYEQGKVSRDNGLESLTNEIVDKEIALLQLNTHYRIESTKQSKFKPWRTAAFSFSSYLLSNIGIDDLAYARWKYWRTPAVRTPHFYETAPTLLLIGHSIGLAGVATEIGLDRINDMKLRRRGYDRKTFTKNVIRRKTELDELLASRRQLVNETTLDENERAIALQEGKVLQDVRDVALSEYVKFSQRRGKFAVGRDMTNTIAAGSLATGGFAGALNSFVAAQKKKPAKAGPAGIGFTISGALLTVNPILSRLAGQVESSVVKKQTEAIAGAMDGKPAERLHDDKARLALLMSGPTHTIEQYANRERVYELEDHIFERQSALALAEKKQSDRDFIERVVASSIIGGTKMAYGIQLINAGYGYHAPPPAPPKPAVKTTSSSVVAKVVQPAAPAKPKPSRASQLFSQRVAEGATTFIPGTAVGMLDVLQQRVHAEVRTHKQRSMGTDPGTIMARRLSDLEAAHNLMATKLAGDQITH